MNFLTTKQIAEKYDVAPVTAKKWVQKGLFKNAIKPGRDWIVPDSDLINFVKPSRGRPKINVSHSTLSPTLDLRVFP